MKDYGDMLGRDGVRRVWAMGGQSFSTCGMWGGGQVLTTRVRAREGVVSGVLQLDRGISFDSQCVCGMAGVATPRLYGGSFAAASKPAI